MPKKTEAEIDDGGTWHDKDARAEWVRLMDDIDSLLAEHQSAGRGATPVADMAARRTESAGLFDRVRALSNANRGMIGINDNLEIAEGYDGNLPHVKRPDWLDDEEWSAADKLTAQEQVELAEIMLERWRRFQRRALRMKKPPTP